jgi:hypothetical protein
VSLSQIRNFDYAILLCNKMKETRAFYRDVMKFPIETDLESDEAHHLRSKHWRMRARSSAETR